MCIFEYDEEREQRLIRKAEYAEGHEAGERNMLKQQTRKKLLKGKPSALIAEELEQDIAVIEGIIEELKAEENS